MEHVVKNDQKKTALLMHVLTELRKLRALHTGEPLSKRAKLQDGTNNDSENQPSC